MTVILTLPDTTQRIVNATSTLCSGHGGLTNVKQRLCDCVFKANESGEILLPPLLQQQPIRRGGGGMLPFTRIYSLQRWNAVLTSLGIRVTSSLGELDLREPTVDPQGRFPLRDYTARLQAQCVRLGCKFKSQGGGLHYNWGDPVFDTFMLHAFKPNNAVMDAVHLYLPIDALLHARVEDDWRTFASSRKRDYVPLDDVLKQVNRSGLLEGMRSPLFVATADKEALAPYDVRFSTCRAPKKPVANGTTYIYCAEVCV